MPPGANFMPPPMGAPDMPAPPMMGGPPGVYKYMYYSSKKSYDLHNIVLNGKKVNTYILLHQRSCSHLYLIIEGYQPPSGNIPPPHYPPPGGMPPMGMPPAFPTPGSSGELHVCKGIVLKIQALLSPHNKLKKMELI